MALITNNRWNTIPNTQHIAYVQCETRMKKHNYQVLVEALQRGIKIAIVDYDEFFDFDKLPSSTLTFIITSYTKTRISAYAHLPEKHRYIIQPSNESLLPLVYILLQTSPIKSFNGSNMSDIDYSMLPKLNVLNILASPANYSRVEEYFNKYPDVLIGVLDPEFACIQPYINLLGSQLHSIRIELSNTSIDNLLATIPNIPENTILIIYLKDEVTNEKVQELIPTLREYFIRIFVYATAQGLTLAEQLNEYIQERRIITAESRFKKIKRAF